MVQTRQGWRSLWLVTVTGEGREPGLFIFWALRGRPMAGVKKRLAQTLATDACERLDFREEKVEVFVGARAPSTCSGRYQSSVWSCYLR